MIHSDPSRATRQRRANLWLGLVLASIAAVFFAGAIVARYMGGIETGMSVVGLVALVLLVFAVAHHVRDR
ncbi:MAG: cytochrome oxidase small assembly protein [Burkholderiales bacterium]|jgi:amino acid transporter